MTGGYSRAADFARISPRAQMGEEAVHEVSGLSAGALYEFVAGAPQRAYPEETIVYMLRQDVPNYARMFYTLSTANPTLVAASYGTTFLHGNLRNFSEEELLLICEGIKLQLERGECDFYYVAHHFFEGLDRSPRLRSFLLHLMERRDYRIREFLLTHGVVERVFGYETSSIEGRVFVVRFLKAMIGADSGVIKAHLIARGLCISVERRNDCVGFFGRWLERHGSGYKEIIKT